MTNHPPEPGVGRGMWLFLSLALAGPFETLEPGLELATFEAPTRSPVGDSTITVLRADPARFDLVVRHGAPKTARQWADEGFVATTNPGMFEPDGATTFYGRAAGVPIGQPVSAKAGSVLVGEGTGPARVLDTRCAPWTETDPAYGSAVQSYRLLECDGSPAWQRSDRIWSHAVVAEDAAGRLLFVHVRSPYSTHDLAVLLRALPLDVVHAHYGEGGPEASLYVRAGSVDREWVGSYETGFHPSDDNRVAWPLPNVVGLRRR